MLFDDKKKHSLNIPAKDEHGPTTVGSLVKYLCKNVMKDQREEMFVLDGHVFVLPSCLTGVKDAADLLKTPWHTSSYK